MSDQKPRRMMAANPKGGADHAAEHTENTFCKIRGGGKGRVSCKPVESPAPTSEEWRDAERTMSQAETAAPSLADEFKFAMEEMRAESVRVATEVEKWAMDYESRYWKAVKMHYAERERHAEDARIAAIVRPLSIVRDGRGEISAENATLIGTIARDAIKRGFSTDQIGFAVFGGILKAAARKAQKETQ